MSRIELTIYQGLIRRQPPTILSNRQVEDKLCRCRVRKTEDVNPRSEIEGPRGIDRARPL